MKRKKGIHKKNNRKFASAKRKQKEEGWEIKRLIKRKG